MAWSDWSNNEGHSMTDTPDSAALLEEVTSLRAKAAQLQQELDRLKGQGESAIRESEERFRAVFEKAPDGILVIDFHTGDFLLANKAVCDLTGYDARELSQLGIGGLFSEETVAVVRERLDLGAQGRLPPPADFHLRTRDGRILCVNVHPEFLNINGTRCAMGILRDVTEQRRASAALEESERRLRDVFDNMPIGVYHTDPAGCVLMANPAFIRMLGYSSFTELARQNVEEMYLNSHYPRSLFRRQIEEAGRVVDFESAWRRPDGSIVHTIENARVVRDAGGRVLYYEGTIEDITERARMETALRRSENRYRTLVESAGETIAVVDKTGAFLFVNSTAAEWLGGEHQQFIGKTMWELFPRPTAERQMASIRKVIETGQGIDVVVPTEVQGAVRWYNTTVVPLAEGDGRIHSALIIGRDVHELRQAQKELEEYRAHMARAERLASLGTLSATVAHEINQPLTVMRLTLQTCLDELDHGDTSPQETADRLKECLENVSWTASIVQRFRTFARSTTPRRPGRTSLRRVADRVVRLWEGEAQRMKVRIALQGLDEVAELDADEGDMEQVFFCLLENAIQAADGQTAHQIRISGATTDESIEVRFIDDCGGIAPEHMNRIFEPFFTTKGEEQGTGLGLCIVQQAVSRAEGKIRVENRPREGVTFIVTLPLHRRRNPPAGCD
jgi:PAS domain S-box-containing protein